MVTNQLGPDCGIFFFGERSRWTVRAARREVVMMDKDYKKRLERVDQIPGPKRVHTTRDHYG